MREIFNKIKLSFLAACKGNEKIENLIYRWGASAFVSAFLINKTLKYLKISLLSSIISVILIIYFAWHIYALKKCSPKKVRLSKEEKEKLKMERKKELPKKIIKKVFLQESFAKMDAVMVTMVLDAFCIAHFLGYL